MKSQDINKKIMATSELSNDWKRKKILLGSIKVSTESKTTTK
jgi:hypothetical protein